VTIKAAVGLSECRRTVGGPDERLSTHRAEGRLSDTMAIPARQTLYDRRRTALLGDGSAHLPRKSSGPLPGCAKLLSTADDHKVAPQNSRLVTRGYPSCEGIVRVTPALLRGRNSQVLFKLGPVLGESDAPAIARPRLAQPPGRTRPRRL